MGRKICCQSFTAVKEPVQATLQLALLSAPAAWPTSEACTRAGRGKLNPANRGPTTNRLAIQSAGPVGGGKFPNLPRQLATG
jgi:hypothetical protein